MARKSFCIVTTLLLATYISFVPGIQGGFSNPYPSSADNLIDIGAILNRLDQIDLRDHNQQIVIDQLTKKNVELERKLESILLHLPEDGNDNKLRRQNAVVAGSDSKDFLPRSCYELKASNPNAQSGFYFIDPDGQINGDDPVQAYCDMDTRTTSILHDTEVKTDVTNCGDPGCYTKQVKYNATLRQMAMLADISGSCKQYFRFDSLSVPLEFDNSQYGFWNDRNGAKQIFWAGPANSNHTCQCGLENPNRCVDTRLNCNADSLAPIELVDEGYITASELLPVTRLSFGRTNLIGVKASYTLGRFECTGQAPVSSKPENCRTLFQMGHTISGFYLVKSGSTKVATTYCDFSKDSVEAGYETRIGYVDVISSPVQFYVQRNTNWATANTPMPFQVTNLIGVKASYTLGRFECTGQAPVSSKPENCKALFQMGHTVSGFYLVKSGSTKIATTYCDFSKGSAEAGYETRIGNNDIISSPVQFFVQKNTIWNTTNTPMPFQIERLNIGNAMNLGTGVFKAPKAGTYYFAFSGIKSYAAGHSAIEIRLNGNRIGNSFFGNTNINAAGSLHATLKLKTGDEITLQLNGFPLYDDGYFYTHFTGILLEEDLVIP